MKAHDELYHLHTLVQPGGSVPWGWGASLHEGVHNSETERRTALGPTLIDSLTQN